MVGVCWATGSAGLTGGTKESDCVLQASALPAATGAAVGAVWLSGSRLGGFPAARTCSAQISCQQQQSLLGCRRLIFADDRSASDYSAAYMERWISAYLLAYACMRYSSQNDYCCSHRCGDWLEEFKRVMIICLTQFCQPFLQLHLHVHRQVFFQIYLCFAKLCFIDKLKFQS